MVKTKKAVTKIMKYEIQYYHPALDTVIHVEQFRTSKDVYNKHKICDWAFWKYLREPELCKCKKGFVIKRIPKPPKPPKKTKKSKKAKTAVNAPDKAENTIEQSLQN